MWATVAMALAGCLWGTAFLFGKIALREMTVSENVVFRFLIASVALLPILLRAGRIHFRRSHLLSILLAAFIGVPVEFLIQFKGLQLTTVSHASLIVGTMPVLIALTSALFLHDHVSRFGWLVLLLSPLGVLLIALSASSMGAGNGPTAMGDFLVLLSMFAAVTMIIITKQLMAEYDPIQITAWMLIIGAILLTIGVELWHPVRFHFSPQAWLSVAAQGLLATVGAYLLWNWGLARVKASHAGVYLNLEPLFGTFLGVVILHEQLRVSAIAGAILILGPAVYFSRRIRA